jgi:hypothetical protein
MSDVINKLQNQTLPNKSSDGFSKKKHNAQIDGSSSIFPSDSVILRYPPFSARPISYFILNIVGYVLGDILYVCMQISSCIHTIFSEHPQYIHMTMTNHIHLQMCVCTQRDDVHGDFLRDLSQTCGSMWALKNPTCKVRVS